MPKEAVKVQTKIMHEIAKISMRLLHQIDDLIKCEGEVFENFKKMNI